jgi:photosystem II stability/assembly factor-like uncharacterized protein
MKRSSLQTCGRWMVLAALGALSACGGGGGETPPTAIPENLSISAPASADAGGSMRFGSSAGAAAGLKYSWTFGDGATSTEAAPSHSFASGGEYEVVLKVTNEIGASRETRSKVSVTNIANVRGLVCTGADSTGWCWQNPRPTGNRINSVFFLNANLGWRAGDAGEIFKTTDGGTTWVKQNSGISAAVQGIAFVDAQTGWATGAYGAILRTTDGGTSWAVDKIGDGLAGYYDTAPITPLNASTLYLGRIANNSNMYYGTALVSTDAGATWRQISGPSVVTRTGALWSLQGTVLRRSLDSGKTYANVLEVKAADGSTYFDALNVVANDELRAAVLASRAGYDYTTQKYVNQYIVSTTADGGSTWNTVAGKGLDSYGTYLRLLSMSDNGMTLTALANSNVLLRSADGGQNWTSAGAIDPTNSGMSVSALGDNMFVASGYSGLFISEDGGQTWPRLALPANVMGYSLSYNPLRRIDAQTFLLTDYNGNSYLTKNWGEAWTLVSAAQSYFSQTLTVGFRDAKNGFMVDEKGRSLATQDGGASWQVRRSDFGQALALQFSSKQTGWLVGADGRLYKSTDGGETWLTGPVAQGTYYSQVRFDSEALGWVRRSGYVNAGFAATQDGGVTWTDLNLPYNIVSLRLGQEAWIAVGDSGTVLVSKDRGASWKTVYTGTSAYLYAATFSDAKTAWIVGSDGMLLKSVDAGATWTLSKPGGSNGLRDIRFANAQVGWMVGDNGVILATVDGGKVWRQQSSGTMLPLASIQAVDVNTAWISGPGGVLLATGNGGN